VLQAYDRIVGLALDDIPVDGCHTKAVSGGECAGPSPVDRRKGGMKRSTATDGNGIPLGAAAAPGQAAGDHRRADDRDRRQGAQGAATRIQAGQHRWLLRSGPDRDRVEVA
jgi:hypothetical protein